MRGLQRLRASTRKLLGAASKWPKCDRNGPPPSWSADDSFRASGRQPAPCLSRRVKTTKAAKSKPKIVIVGAGIAGLNAALTLQDAGFASTIYELSDRIGGRVHSDTTTWQNDQKSEWCGEFIDSDNAMMMSLAKRFKLTLVDEIAAQPAGSFDTLYFDGHYYSQAQADQDFVPVNAAVQRQVNAAPSTTYNSSNATGYYLDQLSVYEWIEKYVPGGHHSQLGRYLNSAYNQEYGLYTPIQSSLDCLLARLSTADGTLANLWPVR